ncbi:hypothetical protein VZ95_16500 [Elstera litoralis]|uniref:Lipoprotein n=1 Tax=Elstera litoralis TaxID=552518 RepID=A0A0F3IPU9_9PROT|nr:hypothetical protein [Elstera litoralis]KJV08642.1 hypothetical protein VZ95_16500 [Elstera litoralis]
MIARPLVALLFVAGCAAAPAWEKAGGDTATRDKDLAACQQELRFTSDEARRRDTRVAAARGELAPGRGTGYEALRGDIDASAQRRRDSRALTDCMQAKGYTSVP